MPANEASFSERYGYARPKEIIYRDDLAEKLRQPIIDILRESGRPKFLWERIERLFNRYGIEDWPPPAEPITLSKDEDDLDFIAVKRVLLRCEWFRLYDLLEDIFDQLYFHDTEIGRAHV